MRYILGKENGNVGQEGSGQLEKRDREIRGGGGKKAMLRTGLLEWGWAAVTQ